MKGLLNIIFFFSALSFSITMQAQQPAFYHLSTAEGLSDNNVNWAARDKNGILWIATTEGLNSFDGNRITPYYKDKHPQLPDNHIARVVVDAKNRVWVRTSSHYLTMLDENRRFHKILVGDTTDKTVITHIFLTATHGLIVLKNNQHFFQQKNNPLKFERRKLSFEKTLGGNAGFTYFLANDKAVYHRNSNLVVVDYNTLQMQLQHRYPGISGANYITDDELLLFTVKGDVFYRFSISQKKVIREYRNIADQNQLPITGDLRNVSRIDSNRFAFTTYFNGLYIIDLYRQSALHWAHDPIDPRSIGGNNTYNVRYDTSGYLFVTTITSGLHYYNLKQQQAATKSYFSDAGKNIFDGYIQSIVTDNGSNVWMGAQDRLIKWNRATDQAEFIPLRLTNGTNISGRETIRAVNRDEAGNIWVGTTRHGILIVDKNQRIIKQIKDSIPGKTTKLPSPWVNTLCKDRHGDWWAGTTRGISIINKNNFEIISLNNHPVLDTVSKMLCFALWKDENGDMWIGTNKGVWHYNEPSNKLSNYTTKDGLPNNTVYAINKDNLGNTYFATFGGLSILSKEGKIFSYTRSNGLKNDRCEGLLKDEKGYIWIGNLTCIIRYDPINKTFTVFEEGIGFSHGGFRMRSCYKNNSGEMFWGTDKGLIWFYPEQMSSSILPLNPSINSLRAGNINFGFTQKEQLQFPYNTASFLFSFSSGELSGDKRNQLKYQLRGFDKDWQTTVTTGQAVYSKLPPGRYSFHVKASRDGINWFPAQYPVEFVITKPWWQQTWFRIICIVVVASVIFFNIRHFKRKRKTKEINNTIEYFAGSSYEHASPDDILWDISHNCISRLGFEDCVIYVPHYERKVLIQKAAYGPKNPNLNIIINPIEIPFGKGIVGNAALSGKAILVHDTSKDSRYIVDDQERLSELAVPIIHEGKVIGVIDSEHRKKNFFTRQHLAAVQSIASICAAKISRSMAMEAMKKNREELMALNVKMAESKFLNLRLQMNPHFLFNSLSAIQHLIVSQQTNKAYKYLTVFSNFLRSLLNFAEKNFIPLDEELKILNMYSELESLRFDESFTWKITTDENLAGEEVFVPSLMVQPFAENAIWHGLLHKEGKKELNIHFSGSSEDYLTCTIEDNGIGREKANQIKEANINSKMRTSKGIQIINERLELLQQKTGKPAKVEIEDLFDATNQPAGTRVKIIIPYYNPEET